MVGWWCIGGRDQEQKSLVTGEGVVVVMVWVVGGEKGWLDKEMGHDQRNGWGGVVVGDGGGIGSLRKGEGV